MNRKISGAVKASASLVLAGGVIAAAALPAAAASPNYAYAVGATGLIAAPPIAEATYPGTSPVMVADANVAGLITTGIVTDQAGPTSASSTVATVSARLTALVSLTARAVTSECHIDTATGALTGSATITGGAVSTPVPITLAVNPPKNTTVSVPGIATITLNKQTVAPDGTLTVDAIYVAFLGRTQTLTIAESSCNAASLAPVPVLPHKTLAFSVGGLGLLLIGGFGYQISRRRRRVTAA